MLPAFPRKKEDMENSYSPPALISPTMGCLVCHKTVRAITDSESGETICSGCGMVFNEYTLDDSRNDEWTMSIREEITKNKTTIKAVPTELFSSYFDRGLTTKIGTTNKDFSGHELDIAMRSTFERLRTWDKRMKFHSSKSASRYSTSLWNAFYRLSLLKVRLGLSDAIVEKAAYTYRKAQQRRLVSGGRTISSVLAAALYITCREIGTPRPLNEIAAASDIKRKDVARNCRLLINKLDIKVPKIDPMKCIARIANAADINERTKRHALKFMDEIISKEISVGKDPMSLCAALLYVLCKKNRQDVTQADIAKAAGTTEVTIRKRFKDLEAILS